MNVKETDIFITLEEKFNQLPNKMKITLGELTPTNVSTFFKNENINSLDDIPKDDKFLELYANYPQHTSDLLNFLNDALTLNITKNKIEPKVRISVVHNKYIYNKIGYHSNLKSVKF